jgi:hypothetical protein
MRSVELRRHTDKDGIGSPSSNACGGRREWPLLSDPGAAILPVDAPDQAGLGAIALKKM